MLAARLPWRPQLEGAPGQTHRRIPVRCVGVLAALAGVAGEPGPLKHGTGQLRSPAAVGQLEVGLQTSSSSLA